MKSINNLTEADIYWAGSLLPEILLTVQILFWNAANMAVVFLFSVLTISALLTNSSDKFNLNTSKYFQFKGFFTGNITQTPRFGETMNLNTSFALSRLSFARSSRPIVASVGPDPQLSLIHFGETIQYNTIITWSSAPLSRHHYGSARTVLLPQV